MNEIDVKYFVFMMLFLQLFTESTKLIKEHCSVHGRLFKPSKSLGIFATKIRGPKVATSGGVSINTLVLNSSTFGLFHSINPK